MRVLIAAGGTGGHIYPALAIADAFKTRPDLTVEFVGTAHGLENKIVPPKGYKVHHLPIGRLNSNVPLGERLKTVFLLPWALVKSALLLRRERPSFVLGRPTPPRVHGDRHRVSPRPRRCGRSRRRRPSR